MSYQPSPILTAARAIAADLAEEQIRSNIADMFIENAAAKAAAVRAAVEADFNRANSPAEQEYKVGARMIYGACYDLIDKGCQGWRLTREPRWTKELPTEEGYYWVRRKHDIPMQVAHVVLLEGHLMCTIGHQGGFLKYHTNYDWAGPLSLPLEPTA